MKMTIGSFQAGRTTILPVFIGQEVEQLGVKLQEYHGKVKDHPVWFDHEGTRFIVVGMGQPSKFTTNKFRNAVAIGVRAANKEGETALTVLLPVGTAHGNEELAHIAAESLILGGYRYGKYKAQKEEQTVEDVTVASLEGELTGLENALLTGRIYAEGTCIARDLKNEPSNKMRPYDLVEYVQNLFAGTDAKVEVYKGDDLVQRQMNGLISVGQGSANPPAMIQVTYTPDTSKPLTALVGKGLTFDTGGISLKPGRDLSNMRMDMGGAAAVIGAMYILTRLQAQVNVVMLVPTAENMPDGAALLPGAIIEYPNGINVHVGNTDAEGRLVLVDGLILANELGAKRVVDIATLTGACAAALGSKLAGVWGNEEVVSGLKQSSGATGEGIWEMPLVDEYEEMLYSPIADVKNISDGMLAGAITAALFLRRFVGEGQQWAHLDIAGPMDANRVSTFANEGATGFGARLLADWLIK